MQIFVSKYIMLEVVTVPSITHFIGDSDIDRYL